MRYLFPTGKGYQRKWLGQDVLSGVVIAAVSIPISMGYAQIAGLPAVYGLYGSLLPVILFALLSTSPQFIFGVDAAPAAMIGGVLGGMGIAMGSAEAERVVPVLTFCVGIWLLLFALLRKVVLQIPLLILLNRFFPPYGIAYAELIAELFLAVVALITLRKIFRQLDRKSAEAKQEVQP